MNIKKLRELKKDFKYCGFNLSYDKGSIVIDPFEYIVTKHNAGTKGSLLYKKNITISLDKLSAAAATKSVRIPDNPYGELLIKSILMCLKTYTVFHTKKTSKSKDKVLLQALNNRLGVTSTKNIYTFNDQKRLSKNDILDVECFEHNSYEYAKDSKYLIDLWTENSYTTNTKMKIEPNGTIEILSSYILNSDKMGQMKFYNDAIKYIASFNNMHILPSFKLDDYNELVFDGFKAKCINKQNYEILHNFTSMETLK